MKLFIVFASLVLAINASTDEELWIQFKQEHSKTYKSLREEKLRFDIFKSTLRTIEEHNAKYNAGVETYYMGLNQFSDLTDEEFEQIYLSTKKPEIETIGQYKPLNVSVPEEVDWRSKAVVEVKNQKSCGSCWAFSTTGSLEGQYAIKHNTKISLSEQELIDCSTKYGNQGCNGGWMDYGFDYIKKYGIATEDDYSYLAVNSVCKNTAIKRSDVKITAYVELSKSEDALKEAVATIGPISVAINGNSIKSYAGGVFNNIFCSKTLNHGVLVVGYGTADGRDYWLVKNSWGATWGDKGYIQMSRNHNNQCGICSACSYPIIE